MNKFSLYLPDGKRKPFSLISPTRNIEPAEFYEIIRSGEIQLEQILNIRELSKTKELALENKNEITANKEYLAGARMSGTFVGGVNDENMIAYSYRLVVDIDKQFEDLSTLKEKIIKDAFVEAAFISVSGKGLAVVIRVELKTEPNKEVHRELFFAIEKYFHEKFQVEIDKSCKNLSRFRYISHDPEIFINFDSWGWTDTRKESIFEKKKPELPKSQPTSTPQVSSNEISDEALCIERAVNYVTQARDGQKHTHLRDAAHTLGGYVATGIVNEQLAIDTLFDVICGMDISDKNKAYKTIVSGIETGKYKPLHKIIRPSQTPNPQLPKPIPLKSEWWGQLFNEKGVFKGYEYDMSAYTKWLTDNYNIFRYTHSNGNRDIVRSNYGILSVISKDSLHDMLKPYFDTQPETLHTDIILNSTKKREFFDPNYGLMGVAEVTESGKSFEFRSKDKEFLFFQNCIVEVSKNGTNIIEYKDFNGLLWDDQVIKRDYIPAIPTQTKKEKGEYQRFVENLAGDGIDSFRSALGYMLHSYKSASTAKAVILHDQNLTDKANGGTGKSLFASTTKYYKSMCYSDGKNVKSNDNFLFENVTNKTQVLFIDDLRRGFTMGLIYNRLTGDWELNKKFVSKSVIPFALSAKIIATTNYTIKKAGVSDERRIFSLEVTNFFNSVDNRVYDYFGHDLFNDWVGDLYDEWSKMDEFVIGCIALYLQKGLINQRFVALSEKEYKTEVGEELINFLDDMSKDGILRISTYQDKNQDKHSPATIRKQFIDHLFEQRLPDKYYRNLTVTALWDKVQRWAEFNEFTLELKRSGNNRYYLILNEKIMQQQGSYTPEQLIEGWLDD